MLQDAAARQQQRQQQQAGPQYNMQWIQGDALKLPFEASSLDAATMGYGLRNVASIPTALQVVPGKDHSQPALVRLGAQPYTMLALGLLA